MPQWLRELGNGFSIGCLLCLGLLNLLLVVRTPAHELVRPTGLRTRLLRRLTQTAHPLAIAGIGALFALSVDTISEATLFSVTAARFGGWGSAAVLGVLFTLGMLIVDGANGAWVAALVRSGDHRARSISRIIGLTIAMLSLAVAALGIVDLLTAGKGRLAGWLNVYIGAALVAGVAVASYLLRPRRTKSDETGRMRNSRDQVEGRA